MRRLNESRDKQVKYLGEGKVGVYQNGKLVERYQLEKGDDLMEAFGGRKLAEAISYNRKVDRSFGYITHIWNIPLPEGSAPFHIVMEEYPKGNSSQGFGYGCIVLYVGDAWGDQAIKPRKYSGVTTTVENPQYIAPKVKSDYGVTDYSVVNKLTQKVEKVLKEVENGSIDLSSNVNDILPYILEEFRSTPGAVDAAFKIYRGKALR